MVSGNSSSLALGSSCSCSLLGPLALQRELGSSPGPPAGPSWHDHAGLDQAVLELRHAPGAVVVVVHEDEELLPEGFNMN